MGTRADYYVGKGSEAEWLTAFRARMSGHSCFGYSFSSSRVPGCHQPSPHVGG